VKDIWKKHRLAVIVSAYIVAVVLLIYFLAVPAVLKIGTVSDQIQEKLLDQEIIENRLGKLPQMEEDWRSYDSQRDSLETVLGADSEIGFIESIESIADKTGNIISLNIGSSADPQEISKIKRAIKGKDAEQKGILDEIAYMNYFPMQIKLKGNYAGLVNFIRMLENSRFYVNVISVETKKEVLDVSEEAKDNPFSQNADETAEKKNKKEIINTDINAIVYTKN
jgi:hypothetical protein